MTPEEYRELAAEFERRAKQYELAVDDLEEMEDPDVTDDELTRYEANGTAHRDLAADLRSRAKRTEGSA